VNNIDREHLSKKVTASSDDAGFLEAEIGISFWCRGANDDVIDQLELENSAGFINPAREAEIRFRRTRVAARVIMLC
jgi:hypothetical protein